MSRLYPAPRACNNLKVKLAEITEIASAVLGLCSPGATEIGFYLKKLAIASFDTCRHLSETTASLSC
jgi:hypothetical protein